MVRRTALSASLLLAVGCKPPPEAPEEFSDLCAYLFEHHQDEDTEALRVGLEELTVWLDEEWDADANDDGFEVTSLSVTAMESLDDHERTNTDMVGLSLPTISAYTVDDSTQALVAVDQDEVFPGTFEEYERVYLSGPDCFVDHECERMAAEEYMTSNFGLGVSSVSHSMNQYVWVELDRGQAMVHRNWQVEPPEVNMGWLRVTEQTYLDIFVPRDGGAYRLQAQWTVYDPGNDVPEDMAKATIISSFQTFHDDLEQWLEEQEGG